MHNIINLFKSQGFAVKCFDNHKDFIEFSGTAVNGDGQCVRSEGSIEKTATGKIAYSVAWDVDGEEMDGVQGHLICTNADEVFAFLALPCFECLV